MKVSFTALVVAAALLGLAPAAPVQAGSNATYAGSGCKVFGSTAWTDLQFGARGISNLASAPRNIICPLVKESENGWDGAAAAPTNYTYVHFHLMSGNNALMSSCNVYVVDGNGNLLNTYTSTVGGYPNWLYSAGTNYLDAGPSPVSGDHQHATMLCTLAPGARLNYYKLYEGGATTLP